MSMETADDINPSHRDWIESLTEARQNCRELLYDVERDPGTDPEGCFNPTETERRFHAAILDYHALVAPYSDHPELSGGGSGISQDSLWGEQITHPETGETIEFQAPTVSDDGELIRQPQPVKLHGFEAYFSQRVLTWQEETFDEKHGTTTKTKKRRVWVPPKVGRSVYHQLNRCTESLGFAAEMDTSVDEQGDPF